jgi:hypothetical protein
VDRFSALCTEFYQVKENLYNGLEATLTGKNHKRATDIRRKVIAFNAAMDETNSNFTHNNLGMKDSSRGGQQQSGTTNARDVLWRGFGQDGGRDAGGGGAGADAMEGEAGTELSQRQAPPEIRVMRQLGSHFEKVQAETNLKRSSWFR